MAKEILLCKKCNKFTLKENCECGGKAINPKPARWNPEDKWGKYRREYKQKDLKISQ